MREWGWDGQVQGRTEREDKEPDILIDRDVMGLLRNMAQESFHESTRITQLRF